MDSGSFAHPFKEMTIMSQEQQKKQKPEEELSSRELDQVSGGVSPKDGVTITSTGPNNIDPGSTVVQNNP
jgi:hypothetical protein